jgi:hypothetical protein
MAATGCNIKREDVIAQVMTGAPFAYLLGVSMLAPLFIYWKTVHPRLRMRAWLTALPALPLAYELVHFVATARATDDRWLLMITLGWVYVYLLVVSYATVLLVLWRLWMAMHPPSAFEGASILSALFFLPGFLIIRGHDPTGRLYEATRDVWIWTSLFGAVPVWVYLIVLVEGAIRAARARRAQNLVDRAMGVRR